MRSRLLSGLRQNSLYNLNNLSVYFAGQLLLLRIACSSTLKKILFISTLNLATNPRLFKEIELALNADFEVDVVCFEFDNWSYEFNQQLKERIANARLTTIRAGR